jgi:hypothetical protein
MNRALWLHAWIGRVFVGCLALVALLPGLGCSRLNLWEGPSYRDDPVVSDAGTSNSTKPAADSSHSNHQKTHLDPTDEVIKTSRANR